MKRIFVLLLAVVMLFAFAACNNDNQKENNNDKQLVADYMGEWKANALKSRLDNEITYQVATITLQEDGTCIYKGESAKWEYVADLNQFIFTLDKNGASGVLEIAEENGKIVLKYDTEIYYRPADFVSKDKEYVDNGGANTDDTQVTPTNSKEITITIDNWNEYFDVIEYPYWKENAFGEIDDLAIWWGISLKEEYNSLIDTEKEQSVAFELSGKYNNYGIQVDTSKKQYTYTDLIYADGGESVKQTATFDFLGQYNAETKVFNFLRVWSSGIGEADKDGEMIEAIYRYYDISVLRAEGKIYLLEQ